MSIFSKKSKSFIVFLSRKMRLKIRSFLAFSFFNFFSSFFLLTIIFWLHNLIHSVTRLVFSPFSCNVFKTASNSVSSFELLLLFFTGVFSFVISLTFSSVDFTLLLFFFWMGFSSSSTSTSLELASSASSSESSSELIGSSSFSVGASLSTSSSSSSSKYASYSSSNSSSLLILLASIDNMILKFPDCFLPFPFFFWTTSSSSSDSSEIVSSSPSSSEIVS